MKRRRIQYEKDKSVLYASCIILKYDFCVSFDL